MLFRPGAARRAVLAFVPLAAACGGADLPGNVAPARCPPLPAITTAGPVATAPVSVPPPALSAVVEAQPVNSAAQRLLWADTYSDGDVLIEPVGKGVALVPQFLGAIIEGTFAGMLDEAGVPAWQTRFPGIGAVSFAVAPDGAVLAIAVDQLDWPKTPEAYEQRRVVVIEKGGQHKRSWQLPAGVELSQIEVDSDSRVLLAGRFTGTVKLSPAVTLRSPAGGGASRSFVARTDLNGKVLWARDFELPASIEPAAGGKVIVHEAPEDPKAAAERLALLDSGGSTLWKVDVPAGCRISSLLPAAPGGMKIVGSTPCFGSQKPDEKEGSGEPCELVTLDAATGRATDPMPIPGCHVRADAQGFVVLDEQFDITVLDAAGKKLWSASPEARGCMQFGWNGVALAEGSIFLAGHCEGERIGTMFNSPYSRATDMSVTYLVRYARN